ncbi:MAG: hypothetical protein OXT67_05365 [Zetaproteobacteria bacterium]|nr:hypothetical protein [Zetaproteobacteria bacterium]
MYKRTLSGGWICCLLGMGWVLGVVACDRGATFSETPASGGGGQSRTQKPATAVKDADVEPQNSNKDRTPPPVDPAPPAVVVAPATPRTSQQIVDLCTQGASSLKAVDLKVSFPATQDCKFGQDGNGPRVEAHHQAQKVQEEVLNLPERSTLCDLAVESLSVVTRFDDDLVLTLGDYVLVTTDTGLKYQDAEGLMKWDFARLRGKGWGDKVASCVLPAEQCVFPTHDKPGAVQLRFMAGALAGVVAKSDFKTQIPMKLITLGDNDDGDCEHEGLNLKVRATVHLPAS